MQISDWWRVIWRPIPLEPHDLVAQFYQRYEESALRLMRIAGYLGCVVIALLAASHVALVKEQLGLVLLIDGVGIVGFLWLAEHRRVWRRPSSAPVFTVGLALALASAVGSSIVVGNVVGLLIFGIIINNFISIVTWPAGWVRAMLVMTFGSYVVAAVFIDTISADLAIFFPVALLASGGLAVMANAIFSYQRWKGFLAQKKVQDLNIALQERTAELESANSLLTLQNAELDAFSSTVAHDLKNPLGAIEAYATMLREDGVETWTKEQLELVERIEQTSAKSAIIVSELLLLARVRRQNVTPERLHMRPIVRQALERLELEIERQGVQVTLADEWPTAVGYGPWVEEVWVNYLSNGIKYGGRPCHLTVGANKRHDGQIEFWVQDNGPGLSTAEQAVLFTEFTRVTQLKIHGHGLGLAIVQRIVQKLDGHVGVQSEVGRGSRFYFTLPKG